MSEWQPIETAPKGVDILLFCKGEYGARYRCIGRFIERYTEESSEEHAEYSEEDDNYFTPEGWYENQFNWGDYASIFISDTPTHWMSLPEPPQ